MLFIRVRFREIAHGALYPRVIFPHISITVYARVASFGQRFRQLLPVCGKKFGIPGVVGQVGQAFRIPGDIEDRLADRFVGDIIARLEEEGDLDNTAILFMTDHGISHARGKQFLYDEGLHVPLVIAGPGIAAGQVRDDLVEHIGIAALSLGLAGIEIPATMQARNILHQDYALLIIGS